MDHRGGKKPSLMGNWSWAGKLLPAWDQGQEEQPRHGSRPEQWGEVPKELQRGWAEPAGVQEGPKPLSVT